MRRVSLTRDDYDRWAATYDAVDNPLVAMATFAVGEAARGFADARVLELGCGTARNAVAIVEGGAAVYVGVDASEEMLARGRARAGDDARVRLVAGDLTTLPPAIEAGAFDVVLFCLVLEHFEHVVASAARALAPGGTLRLFELHPAWWRDGARAHYVDGDGQERALASWAHDEDEFARILPEHGLELVDVRSWYGSEEACRRSPKLRKRLGRPVLLDLRARRR